MRIPVSSIVDSQLPSFVREEFPLFSEFLHQYYLSDVSEDIIQNLDKTLDIDIIFNLRNQATLFEDINIIGNIIVVDSTSGFPDKNGLLKIDNEIILYTSKTDTQFLGCVRGFSGIEQIKGEELKFSQTNSASHQKNSIVYNLSILFLQQFAITLKKRITPGFEEREFFDKLNATNFVKNIKSFYTSKGSDESFRILFGALYGKTVDVIKPRDYLIRPSDAEYRVTKDLVVEVISGDPYTLINSTLFQDPSDFIEPASGTIVEVNKIIRNNKEYFIISLDYNYNRDVDVSGTTRSEFSIHPKTIVTSYIQSGSNYIDVDSTIGFPNRGELEINLEDGSKFTVKYQSKVLNQFLDCSDINFDIPEETRVTTKDFIYSFGIDGQQVSMKVTGVLGEIEYLDPTYSYESGEKIKIKTLGEDSNDFKANNWFFNVSVLYDVQKIELEDSSNFSYKVTTFDDTNFVIGDAFTLYSSDGLIFLGLVSFIGDQNEIIIRGQGELNTNLVYRIRKNISKVNVFEEKYKDLEVFSSNVQNIYLDYDKDVYVSSPSLPNYLDLALDIRDFSLKIPAKDYTNLDEIIFNSPHGLFSGDSVVYKAVNPENSITVLGLYYVKKINNTTIKLARSLFNINEERFVTFNGVIRPGFESSLELNSFNDLNFNSLKVRPQNIIKRLRPPRPVEENVLTQPGTTGILVNGVEISNFKSNDLVFYGGIEEVEIGESGSGYNVLNPPKINVIDPIGFGASFIPAVEGRLERIDIVDPGFDYIDQPVISISGGGGIGAQAEANLVSFIHSVDFNAETLVDTVNNSIEFLNDHKFRDNEEVIYRTDNQKNVSGINTNSVYYIKIENSRQVKLYYTLSDSISGINTVNLSGIGTGIHSLVSTTAKKRVLSIDIVDGGTGFKNRKIKVSGINTASNSLTLKNHGYNDGEIISYYPNDVVIPGLVDSESYYVTKVDQDNIRLSGISTEIRPDINFIRKEYVNINSVVDGDHYFNYPKIEVKISGRIGVSTLSGQDFSAKIQPVFSGQITSIFVENPGNRYGSPEIINFERKPVLQVETGGNAQVTPIIINGSIVRVIVNSTGSGYQQVPELIIGPQNNGAILTPVLVEDKIVDVIVISGGAGFDPNNTSITVVPKGRGVQFEPRIQRRRINIVERLIRTNNITKDDGYIRRSIDSLEYTHLYSPRALRESIFRRVGEINIRDLNFSSGSEQLSITHSPLMGWAYDGNPIYGPYGYANGNSGPIKALKSGYSLKTTTQLISEDRPPLSSYPAGFFVEDFVFTGNGDLDEFNGRFCKTPEFPDGTYAYFFTISDFIADSSSPFVNYYSPVFPYIIGPKYKNRPIRDIVDIEELGDKLLRNTSPYNLLSDKSEYNFILNPNKIKEEAIQIVKTKESILDNIEIIEKGDGYRVGENIVFNDGSTARIKRISGVDIASASVASTSFENIEAIPFRGKFIGVFSDPHNITSSELFTFNSLFEYRKKIVVSPISNSISLASSVAPISQTGIITYFNVNGNLNFPLKENDIYTINDEKVRILKIEPQSSRIKVKRAEFGTSGDVNYEINTQLSDDSRKVLFDIGLTTSYNFKLNSEIYFNPTETLGIGTVGNFTLNISNPGLGKTLITIPTRSLYLENHQLNSGDSLFYSPNDGESIEVSLDGVGVNTLIENQELFVTKINNDLIGLTTELSSSNTLYFTGTGNGLNHSFKTNYSNIFVGNITKNIVTVSTSSEHGLNLDDNIFVEINSGIETSYKVFYNEYNRRFCINKRFIDSVDIILNTIHIQNHKFQPGEKVIYVSDDPIFGLTSEEIYYIIPVTKDTFKVSKTYYNSIKSIPEPIDLISSGNGYFYSVNPKIDIVKNQPILFDVSDPSLAFEFGNDKYSAFELKLYTDTNLLNEYFTYDLVKSGRVGIDSTAKYTLQTENLPDNLYYSLTSINTQISPLEKRQLFVDTIIPNSLKLEKIDSLYSGGHKVSAASSNSFSYLISDYPEIDTYNSINSVIKYSTDSTAVSGPIESIGLINLERNKVLPNLKNIETIDGKNADLRPESRSIGKIEKINKLDIGFDYNLDYTIRPKINIPKIIKVESSFQLDTIGIVTSGFRYNYSPDLILLDEATKTPFKDVLLEYDLQENEVIIIENTNRILNSNVKIIPQNNDNGFDIDTIDFNNTNNLVTVKLKTAFNDLDEYPFNVGERVLIENVPVFSGDNVKGYNSSSYGYSFFKILDSTPNIGGVGATFTYSLDGLLAPGVTPGLVDNFYTSGFAVPESFLPSFDVKLKSNTFLKGETVETLTGSVGEVVNWDPVNNIVKIISNFDIVSGDLIFGRTSNNYAKVIDTYSPKSYIDISSNSIVNKGWSDRIGFLNDNLQRIHDSDYYQYFSYDLRSEVDFSNWSDVVDSLNHTAGFKKFGNLIVNTTHNNVGFETSQDFGEFEVINDLYSVLDVNCYHDFDLVTENYFTIDGGLKSNEIYFKSRRLQNYIESIGNKVITIDDISDKFKPAIEDDGSIVDSFNRFDVRFKKYIFHISDRLSPRNSETLLINLLHNDRIVGINQYAINQSLNEIGFFNAEISTQNLNVKFTPIIQSNKIYNLNSFSFNISDFTEESSKIPLGDVVEISSFNQTGIGTTTQIEIEVQTPIGIATTTAVSVAPTTIARIPKQKRASKVIVVYSDTTNLHYYSDEINYVHDDNKIYFNSYGELNLGTPTGIGTYNLYYDDSDVVIDLYAPDVRGEFTINSLSVQISDTSATSTDLLLLSGNKLESSYVAITTTGTPVKTLIYSHSNNYTSGLHQVVIEDINNNVINSTEILAMLNSSNQQTYSVEFASLNSSYQIGIIEVEYSEIDGNLNMYFTPYQSTNCQVRIFSILLSKFRRSQTLEI